MEGVCRRCGIVVGLEEKSGVLESHNRFPTAAEYAVQTPHPMIPCEGSGTENYDLPEWTKDAIRLSVRGWLAEFGST